jgi:hypothetical protein
MFAIVLLVDTVGEAWQLGWRVTARCGWGKQDGMKSICACIYSYELTCAHSFGLAARRSRCLTLRRG